MRRRPLGWLLGRVPTSLCQACVDAVVFWSTGAGVWMLRVGDALFWSTHLFGGRSLEEYLSAMRYPLARAAERAIWGLLSFLLVVLATLGAQAFLVMCASTCFAFGVVALLAIEGCERDLRPRWESDIEKEKE